MRNRWMGVGLVLALLATAVAAGPVGAQDGGAELENTNARVTVTAWGSVSTGRFGSGSNRPYAGCEFVGGDGSVVANNFLNRVLYEDPGLGAIGFTPDARFGALAFRDIFAGYCDNGKTFNNGSTVTWWVADGTPSATGEIPALYLEALYTINFPEVNIMTAPLASTPFLTNLPVGMRPSVELTALTGQAAIPVQTITVTATPIVTFEAMGEKVTCAGPFPTVEEMLTIIEPSCSLTFNDPTPRGSPEDLTMRIAYTISATCNPGCPNIADRVVSSASIIEIEVAEVIGLR